MASGSLRLGILSVKPGEILKLCIDLDSSSKLFSDPTAILPIPRRNLVNIYMLHDEKLRLVWSNSSVGQ
jgi:hypothetical protein